MKKMTVSLLKVFPIIKLGHMPLITMLFTGLLLLGSCNKCDKDCGGCGVLDEDNCTCIYDYDCLCQNNKQDGNEEYIDCGGDCEPCVCKYEPCEFLTNGDIKKWKFAKIIEAGDSGYEPDECDFDWTYTFRVNHVVESGCPGDQYYTFIWEFNDPEFPDRFQFTDGLGFQSTYIINKLTVDSLIFVENLGTILYLPVDE